MSPPAELQPPFDTPETALRFLEDRVNFERAISVPYVAREFRLDRVRDLLARLGSPHQRMPIIHVAGTKGKGSTAAMTGAMLQAAGYRTGVFTSPHIHRIEERIAVNGQPIPTHEFVTLLARVAPVVQAMDREAGACNPPKSGPTYFDITTAIGLLHFVERQVQIAVLEVGLGGRLDSTNVCLPLVSVITSISFDHTKLLGNTLESIAREKAGIIKYGVPVVSGVLTPGPRQVIHEACRQQHARLVELGADFDSSYTPPGQIDSAPGWGEMDFRYRVPDREHSYAGLRLNLLGHHQATNAAIALSVLAELRTLGWSIPEKAVREGLSQVSWPARIELVARRPAVVIDAAHNVASIDALTRVLEESFAAPHRVLVFATTQDKDLRGMLRLLLPRFESVLFTRYLNNPRAVPPAQLEAVAAELTGRHYTVYDEPWAAWNAVRPTVSPNSLICVTGSFFIAAEMRELVHAQPLAG